MQPTRRAATPVASATVVALAPEPIESDARLLGQALRKLRQEHDARGALELLDRYSPRFLAGPLAPEAALGRIEALMTLRRRQEALRLIESTPALPLGRETTLLRGELRASAGRCREAIGDFGAALSVTPRDALDDRALFGRAFCRARNGDRAGARAEMQQYLSQFPRGRFAVEARRALAEPRGE
jgi:soluble lytic murein transglycosylase